jgi:hypothetical protein
MRPQFSKHRIMPVSLWVSLDSKLEFCFVRDVVKTQLPSMWLEIFTIGEL